MPLQIGNVVLATGVAWARVEAGCTLPIGCTCRRRTWAFPQCFLSMMPLRDFPNTKGGVYMFRRQRVEQ